MMMLAEGLLVATIIATVAVPTIAIATAAVPAVAVRIAILVAPERGRAGVERSFFFERVFRGVLKGAGASGQREQRGERARHASLEDWHALPPRGPAASCEPSPRGLAELDRGGISNRE
ncbi:MAG: hypothetical protein KF819_14245 [Labilithrix sp.]|nr:hypothetical protein [Labilithrix sp.]